jgi:phosphatidate cytidylyltransferase
MENHPDHPETARADAPFSWTHSNLWLRIVSALALAVVAFGSAWLGLLPFAAFVLVIALIMSWEWARVIRGSGIDIALIVQGVAVTAAIGLASFGLAALGVAVLVIGTIIVMSLEFGAHPVLSSAGVLYAGLPGIALLWLRSNEPLGFYAVLFIILVVAATDTGAFAAGRLIGGPRLAVTISPNKTWSGLIGGIGAGALTAAIFAPFIGAAPLGLGLTGAFMGLVAQAGDLAESALKRAFGVKDTSDLLPGHGGFMDRMDGIVSVAVAVALAVLFLDPKAPAAALFAGLAAGVN